jgi:hypothetical protein
MIKFNYYGTLKDGTILNTFFSDENRYLVHNATGAQYNAAIDKAGNEINYTEGNIIPPEETDMTEIEEKAKAYDILMGVSE